MRTPVIVATIPASLENEFQVKKCIVGIGIFTFKMANYPRITGKRHTRPE